MAYASLRVTSSPDCKTAYTNCVYLSIIDATRIGAPTYVSIRGTEAVFIAKGIPQVVDGEIAMNGCQRTVCNLSNGMTADLVPVSAQDFSHADSVVLHMDIKTKKHRVVTVRQIHEAIRATFASHILFNGLGLPVEIDGSTYLFTVAELDEPCMFNRELTAIRVVPPAERCAVAFEINSPPA